MNVVKASPHGARVTGEHGTYWVHRHQLQRAEHNARTFKKPAQVTTGVVATLDEIVTALGEVKAAACLDWLSGAYRGQS